MERPVSRFSCRRLASIRRRARAVLLHWIVAGAVIEEGRDAPRDEREVAALLRAIDRARAAGR